MSSSIERFLLVCPCEHWFRGRPRPTLAFLGGCIGLERCFTFFVNRAGGSSSSGRRLESVFARLYASDFLGGCRDPGEWRAEIGKIDQRKQQTRYPKNVHM